MDEIRQPITKEDVIALSNELFDAIFTMQDPAEQERFFMYRNPIIFIPYGTDLGLENNYEFHQQFIREYQEAFPDVLITALNDEASKVRAKFAIYWEAFISEDEVVRAVIGQDWILERNEINELKIVLFINDYHHFLPGSVVLQV